MTKKMSLAVLFLILSVSSVQSEQQPQRQCLHDSNETKAQKDRRRLALAVVRVVNTLEAWHRDQYGQYAPLPELWQSPIIGRMEQEQPRMTAVYRTMSVAPNTDVIPGFEMHFKGDKDNYMFMLIDRTDPCRSSFFSSERGVIYYSQPIDMPPSPSLFQSE